MQIIRKIKPQQRKKARISPPTGLSRPSNPDMVPSSQSDEEELPPADHQLSGVSTTNKAGATNSSKLPTHRDGESTNAMTVNDHASASQDEVMKDAELDLEPLKPVQLTQMLTPPLSDLSSSPPTPIVSDGAKKSTQNIIADIKARAYAKSFSPESDQFEFQDNLDSSEDEQLPTLPLPAPRSKKWVSQNR